MLRDIDGGADIDGGRHANGGAKRRRWFLNGRDSGLKCGPTIAAEFLAGRVLVPTSRAAHQFTNGAVIRMSVYHLVGMLATDPRLTPLTQGALRSCVLSH